MDSLMRWRVARCCLVPVFALLVMTVVYASGTNQSLFLWFNGLGSLTGDSLWANLTVLGEGWVLVALMLPFVGRRPALVWALVVTALLVAVVVPQLKHIFGMPRPPAIFPADVIHIIGGGYRSRSFPSGHSAAAFAFAGVLWMHFRSPWIRAASLLLAMAVGVSRMAVGVHWPLDVAGGACLGWLCAMAGCWFTARWRWGESLPAQRLIAVMLGMVALWVMARYQPDSPLASWLPKGIAVAVLAGALPGFARLWRNRGGIA